MPTKLTSGTNKTNLQTQLSHVLNLKQQLENYKVNRLSIEILSMLLGFFTSTALSTIPAHAGDWGIAAAAVIVCNQEIISKIKYQQCGIIKHNINKQLKVLLKYCNSIKIGILYGLFVDAFKLGS